MKILSYLIVLLILFPVVLNAQLAPEQIFGFSNSGSRWTRQVEESYISDIYSRFNQPNAAANIYFASGGDTSEIIFISDRASNFVRWLRCNRGRSNNSLASWGALGLHGDSINNISFDNPTAIAVASGSLIYNPQMDHIFIADESRQCLFKTNFTFSRDISGQDMMVVEDSIFVDSLFRPVDLHYIKYSSNGQRRELLVALDEYRSSLFLFTRNGQFLSQLILTTPNDSDFYHYSGFTYKINRDETIDFYLADLQWQTIRGFRMNLQNNRITHIRDLIVGDIYHTMLTDISYHSLAGLWAVDNLGNRVVRVALDLSSTMGQINFDSMGIGAVIHLNRISTLNDRIIIFESFSSETGIISISTGQHFFKDAVDPNAEIPMTYSLDQNYPNPFNPNTLIKYAIPKQSNVTIDVYNILGQKVVTLYDGEKPPGFYSITWNSLNAAGSTVASGIYFYKISAGEFLDTKKMVLIK
jgi:hypothetical protein